MTDHTAPSGAPPKERPTIEFDFAALGPRDVTLGIGNSGEIILGEVVHAHFRADVVDARTLHVDPAALDTILRMGGQGYARTRDYFDLPTMSVERWRAGAPDNNRRHEIPLHPPRAGAAD